MSRGGFKVSRQDYSESSYATPNWLNQFANQEASKTAVEVARKRDSASLYDQLNSIMNGHQGGFSTVEQKVQDLASRIGLQTYLQSKSASQLPLAHLNQQLREKVISFTNNLIETHRGLITLPAIQEEILQTFQGDGISPQDINDPEMSKYLSGMILDIQQRNPVQDADLNNLGKNLGIELEHDANNSDFFTNLLPASTS